MPGIFDHADLHTQADAQIRHPVLPGIPGRQDHAVHAPVAKAARDENPIAAAELRPDIPRRQLL